MTVSELKRRIQPGMTIIMVDWPRRHPKLPPIVRKVHSIKSGGWYFEGNPTFGSGSHSFVEWPKAAQLEETERGFIIHLEGSEYRLEYEWQP